MPTPSIITPVSEEQKKEIFANIIDPRWAKFFYYWMESGNSYRAGLKAGFSHNYSLILRQRIPQKVKNGLLLQLEKQGMTDGFLANRIKILLTAKNKKKVTIKGDLVSESEEVNHEAIDKGLKHALAVRGDLTTSEQPQKHLHLHIDVSKLTPDQLSKFAQTGYVEEDVLQSDQGIS